MFKAVHLVATAVLVWGCAGGGTDPILGPQRGNNAGGKTDTVDGADAGVSGEMGGVQAPDPEDRAETPDDGTGGLPEAGGDPDVPEPADLGGMDAEGAGGSEMAPDDQGGAEAPMVDPFAQALDVNLHRIEFPEGTPAPAYRRPGVDTGFSLGGTEFWQQWPNGHMPTYSYTEGTEEGKRCMYASARRFEAIMNDPPPGIVTLKEESNWRGSFFNWNDDFSQSEFSDGRSARLWAWRTHLIKWISQTNLDGSCFLPTYEMVARAADDCLTRAQRSNGEIQGCRGQ